MSMARRRVAAWSAAVLLGAALGVAQSLRGGHFIEKGKSIGLRDAAGAVIWRVPCHEVQYSLELPDVSRVILSESSESLTGTRQDRWSTLRNLGSS